MACTWHEGNRAGAMMTVASRERSRDLLVINSHMTESCFLGPRGRAIRVAEAPSTIRIRLNWTTTTATPSKHSREMCRNGPRIDSRPTKKWLTTTSLVGRIYPTRGSTSPIRVRRLARSLIPTIPWMESKIQPKWRFAADPGAIPWKRHGAPHAIQPRHVLRPHGRRSASDACSIRGSMSGSSKDSTGTRLQKLVGANGSTDFKSSSKKRSCKPMK